MLFILLRIFFGQVLVMSVTRDDTYQCMAVNVPFRIPLNGLAWTKA